MQVIKLGVGPTAAATSRGNVVNIVETKRKTDNDDDIAPWGISNSNKSLHQSQ
jgi:hypothetical protein